MAPKKKTVAVAAKEETPVAPEVASLGTVEVPIAAAEPAPIVSIAGTPAEMYAQLQAAMGTDAARINDYVNPLLVLMQAAESQETPLLLRVRFLEFVSRYVASLRDASALRKIVTSLVKVISGEDNTPQLLSAAIHCFEGLGPVSMLDKNWEYLSREGADVLMQVMIDREAFPEQVRQAANKVLDSLTTSAFRSVITKLLHWISDDLEDDEPEQLQKERHLAMARLTRLAMSPSLRSQWTDDVQTYTMGLIQRVMTSVDAREFQQLARVAAHLPINKEKGSIPLLEAFLASAGSLDSERKLESVAILARFVPSSAEFDIVPALQASSIMQSGIERNSNAGVLASRVLLFAARAATAEGADALFPFIFQQIQALLSDCCAEPNPTPFSTCNLSIVEAVLLAACQIAKKKSVEGLQKLNEDMFALTVAKMVECVAVLEREVVFGVKVAMQKGEASNDEAEAIACLRNIKTMLTAFAAKHLPTGEMKESWIGQQRLPAVKRGRDSASQSSVALSDARRRGGNNNQQQQQKRSYSSSANPRKKQRTGDNRGPRRGGRRF